MPNVFPEGYFDEPEDTCFKVPEGFTCQEDPYRAPPATEEQLASHQRWKLKMYRDALSAKGLSTLQIRKVMREYARKCT